MRRTAFLMAIAFAMGTPPGIMFGDDVIVHARRVNITSAQDHALVLARRGTLVHSHCNQTEGIGMGSTPEAARRNCCFFGRKVIVDEGVAYSPTARKWFAVIRYR
jgi:hypothetical protein